MMTSSNTAPSRRVVLAVSNLSVSLCGADVSVVSDVSFEVPAGSVLGLVGESGSGKSTVARALLGYARRGLRLAEGRVVVDGRDLLRLSPGELRRARGRQVAYVPQDPTSALNPALRVGRQIRETLAAHRDVIGAGGINDRISELLRDVSLEPARALLRAYPHQLSGGQQQRVTIAMAFACRPAVIVLDEPTTGLDVTTQRHVLETVRELSLSHGVAAVYVTHDLAVVSEIADRVAVMYAGRIIESGATAALFARPMHPYTRGLITAVPSHSHSHILVGIPGHVPPPGRLPVGCAFRPRCGFAVPECAEGVPALLAVGGEKHLVRCIRAAEWAEAPARSRGREARGVRTSSASEDAVLEISALSAQYASKDVLRDISITVPRRQCVAIVGESGSGKTTLARCVVGLHRAYRGQVLFEGALLAASVRDRDDETARRIQYIFQNPHSSLNPRKTIAEVLAQPLRHFYHLKTTEERSRVSAALREVSLEPGAYLHKHPGELSGGEAQRVAIARALIAEPTLLICDEVTSSVDASIQAVIVELLCALQASRGLSMIFITHNLPLVRSIAQAVAVLHDGVVVESGQLSEVLDHPAAPYTVRLFEDAPRLAEAEAG